MCTGSGDPFYGCAKKTKDSTCTTQLARRRSNWGRARFLTKASPALWKQARPGRSNTEPSAESDLFSRLELFYAHLRNCHLLALLGC